MNICPEPCFSLLYRITALQKLSDQLCLLYNFNPVSGVVLRKVLMAA